MTALCLALALMTTPGGSIERDSFGVPEVTAKDQTSAWYWAGRAVAQDRPWQLEVSRRSARGRLAEALGESASASDREVLRTGYTDGELQSQFNQMSRETRQQWQSYAQGITDELLKMEQADELPANFKANGLKIEPWTVLDSAAIAVRMARLFGTGGAGELRNTLLYRYLQGQPCKDKILDVMDDLAWQDDPKTIPTVLPEDDPIRKRPEIVRFTRADTERQLAALPPSNVLELMPAIRLASHESERTIAERENVLYKSGSYAIVVSPSRSTTGFPLLLSGPQMGHRNPSIAYEMALDTPGLKVTGLTVPGIPTILIGATPHSAWGLTSGIADLSDVVFNQTAEGDLVWVDGKKVPLERIERTFKIKGGGEEKVVRKRSPFGVVVLESQPAKVVYSMQTSLWMRELAGFDVFRGTGGLKTVDDFRRVAARTPVTFNLFFALKSGETGYFYCGDVPLRAPGIDPRFPTVGSKANAWRGFVPKSQMPQVINPKGGLIANWNNRPAAWWPNLDTPAWGLGFRNQLLLEQLPTGKIGSRDIVKAIEQIAKRDADTCALLRPWIDAHIVSEFSGWSPLEHDAVKVLRAFDGRMLAGTPEPVLYNAFVDGLREELFVGAMGSFLTPANLAMVTRIPVIVRALNGELSYDYLGNRTAREVVQSAFRKATARTAQRLGNDVMAWKFVPTVIRVTGQPDIPYDNRGTFIQIVELGAKVRVRTVLSPGASEAGTHATDQANLARTWNFKERVLGW